MSPKRFTMATTALVSASMQTHCAVVCCSFFPFFFSFFKLSTQQFHIVVTWLEPCETAAISVAVHIQCTPYNHVPVYSISHVCRVHTCVFSCNLPLHFCQNNWDPSYATVVTWGWNRYWNKSQHRNLTLEWKILPPLLKPVTIWSQVRYSTTELSPLPIYIYTMTHTLPFAMQTMFTFNLKHKKVWQLPKTGAQSTGKLDTHAQ